MKDAFGGIFNLLFVAIFLVIISSVLGFIVNYSKAFKMKNIVISTVEEYEGTRCNNSSSACVERIVDEASAIGYSPVSLNCPKDFTNVRNLYCIGNNPDQSTKPGVRSYRVITQVNMNLPLISTILGFRFFQVSGDTREIRISSGK